MKEKEHKEKHAKESHYKHVLMMGYCFFAIFFSFSTSQSLQTSTTGTLGYINLGSLYAMFAIFSIFGPRIVAVLNPKYAMLLGSTAYFVVVISNYWPVWYIQVPANIIVGIGAAILWNGQCAYLSRCALWDSRFAELTSEYNGTFYSFIQLTSCIGTIICGLLRAIFPNLTNNVLFTLLSIVSLIAVIMLVFLPNVESYESQSSKNESLMTVSMFETLSLLVKSIKCVLMMPIVVFAGMSLAFIVGDVTKDISQKYFDDVWVLVFTSVFYGADALFSYVFGKLSGKGLGRRGCCAIAFVCQALALVFVILYPYGVYHKLYDYIVVTITVLLLAAGDAVWQAQPPAILQSFYGLDRERNAAVANVKMWRSVGSCIQFFLGIFLKSVIGYICICILDFCIHKIDMKKGDSDVLLSEIATKGK